MISLLVTAMKTCSPKFFSTPTKPNGVIVWTVERMSHVESVACNVMSSRTGNLRWHPLELGTQKRCNPRRSHQLFGSNQRLPWHGSWEERGDWVRWLSAWGTGGIAKLKRLCPRSVRSPLTHPYDAITCPSSAPWSDQISGSSSGVIGFSWSRSMRSRNGLPTSKHDLWCRKLFYCAWRYPA